MQVLAYDKTVFIVVKTIVFFQNNVEKFINQALKQYSFFLIQE